MSDYITILLTIVTIINSGLGLLILFGTKKEKVSKIYSLITLSTLLWILSIIFYRQSSPGSIEIWTRILYSSATIIGSIFLFFTYIFPIKDNFSWKKQIAIFIPNVIIILVVVFTDIIIIGAERNYDGENIIFFGNGYWVYVLYILGYFNYSFYRLYRKYRFQLNEPQKRQALLFLVGYLIAAFTAFATNLILPWVGYFKLNWLGQVSTVFIVTFATYAIVKHQLFNIKAIAAEIFVGILWIFILIRIIISSNTQEQIINIGLFLITLVVGVFLIKGINNEIRTRERVELLAHDLSAANDRLKELDAQKTEFVSLASHQLRGPLTAIKGYGSMLLEGDFGELSPMIKDAIEKMYKSTNDLVVIVGDYLDVSRIEQGRMQYDFSRFDLKELIQTVTNELRPNVENAHLTIDFDASPAPSYVIHADKGKIKQVISNIVDNAIKYTPQGGIHIWLSAKQKDKALISISDTGVGIHPDVLPKLFQKFTRAPDASQTNILGTGLGLYVARKMIEAHNGHVWAESTGQGRGSTFFIELDLVDPYTQMSAAQSTVTPAATTPTAETSSSTQDQNPDPIQDIDISTKTS